MTREREDQRARPPARANGGAADSAPEERDESAQGPAVEREETAAEPSEKKERVLHTRIPAVLEQELKKLAENLRVPVSNLVRTILEDALSIADRASGEVERQLRHAARRVSDEREHLRERRRRLEPLEDVLGFQPLVLAQSSSCAKCRSDLTAGTHAWLGITTEPGPRIIVCQRCAPGGGEP